MSINGFGELIESVRELNGVTQEQLSRGISSIPTVSRIENGERVPDTMLAKAFLERLGIATDCVDVYLDDKDYERFVLRDRIEAYIEERNFFKAKKLISDYLLDCDESERLHIQFAKHKELRVKWLERGLDDVMRDCNPTEFPDFADMREEITEIYNSLSEVLRITCSCDNGLERTLLTFEEIRIILEKSFIELILFKSDSLVCQNSVSAINHLLKRIDGMYCDSEELVPVTIGSIVILVKYYLRENDYNSALNLCDSALSRLERTSFVKCKVYLAVIRNAIRAKCAEMTVLSDHEERNMKSAEYCMLYYDRLERLREAQEERGGESV